MMKHVAVPSLVRAVAVGCTLACIFVVAPARVFAQSPVLKLDHLDRLATRAKEAVNVTVDEAMLQMAGGFLSNEKTPASGPNTDVKDLLTGLKAVYVRSYSFDKEGEYSKADVEAVRAQLKAPWSRIVSVTERNGESVDVYMWPEGGQSGGLAIVSAEPKELTVVNIVGNVNLAKLASLGGRFGIPQGLGVPNRTEPATAPPPPPTPPQPPGTTRR